MCLFFFFQPPNSPEYIIVRTVDKAAIFWDGKRTAHIRLPESFKTKTKGLCGTYNDDSSDDFLDFDGNLQSSVQPFADSYISNDCQPTAYNPPQCAYECTELDQSYFAPCHGVVDKDFFKHLCKMDACASNEVGRPAAVCAILDVYSRQCAMNGIQLNWRRSDFCRKCSLSQSEQTTLLSFLKELRHG